MKYGKAIYILTGLLILFLSGCTNIEYTPTLSKSYKPTEDKAYIYGRLDRSAAKGINGLVTLALVTQDPEKTRNYIFGFENNKKVRVLEIEPGTYEITHMLTGGGLSEKVTYLRPSYSWSKIIKEFRVEANKAYCIGDLWFNWVSCGPWCARWVVEEIVDRYDDASLELKEKYPRIAELPRQRAFEL